MLTEKGSVLDDPQVDPTLIKTIAWTRRLFDDLANGRMASLEAIGRRIGISARSVGSLMSLGSWRRTRSLGLWMAISHSG